MSGDHQPVGLARAPSEIAQVPHVQEIEEPPPGAMVRLAPARLTACTRAGSARTFWLSGGVRESAAQLVAG